MEKEYLSTIWPILYFEADWPQQMHNFAFGIQLIKADKSFLENIWGIYSDVYSTNNRGCDDIRNYTDWFLAMHRPEVAEHVPVNEIGMSFLDRFESAIVDSFLMCLRIVRSTASICPFKFRAEIHEDSIEINTNVDLYGINSDMPPVYSPETFEVGDLKLITDLWSAIIELRKLDYWKEEIGKEEFFSKIDKIATEGFIKEWVDLGKSRPRFSELSKEKQKQSIERINIFAKLLIKDGHEWFNESYKDYFRKGFVERQEEVFSNRTRIGRALNIFSEGLGLPTLHSFLSMCLVLETLFTIGEAEILHKLATRAAKIIEKEISLDRRKEIGLDQRKDIYKCVKKVYDERSKIVHGEKLIDVVNPEILKNAFTLARLSIQSILLKDELLRLYSHPGTTDKPLKGSRKKEKNSAYENIRDFFLDLDLEGK
jgi:hypothetical protein